MRRVPAAWDIFAVRGVLAQACGGGISRGAHMYSPKSIAAVLCCAAFAAGNAQAQAFNHPGVVVNQKQLDFVKAKIAAGSQPWKNAFDKMKASSYASLSYSPKPRANVECGSYSNPNNGCSDERGDAAAAYAHALLWAYTGNKANADKAIQILNA